MGCWPHGVEAYLEPDDSPACEGFLRFCLDLWAHKKLFPGTAGGLTHALEGEAHGKDQGG